MILFPPQLSGAATPKRLEIALPVIKLTISYLSRTFYIGKGLRLQPVRQACYIPLIINMATLSIFGWTDGLREIWGSTPRLMDIGRFLARYGVQP